MAKIQKNTTMPVSFEQFKEQCRERGYVDGVVDQSVYAQPQNIYAMRTKNKVKTEVKPDWYTVGFGRTKEELELLRNEMTEKGYNITKVQATCFNVAYESGVDVMSRFWDIVALVEDIDGIVGRTVGIARKVFTREEADNSIFEKIAKRYRFAIENQDQDLLDMARTLLSGDSIDHIITRGQSVNRTEEDSYREHVVPCIMIHNRAIDMTLNGNTVVEVAQMVAANLAIVLITNAEAELLDNTLGWRTVMPMGWDWGQDPLARLVGANIALK
jgi:hypothetical protein